MSFDHQDHAYPRQTGALTTQSGQAFSASGGSSTFQTLSFNNANGITFSNNGGAVEASHNGLTTAMASNRGSDFVQATAAFAGTSASGTIASGGISVSIGPYITTAALSNHSHGNPSLNLTNLSGTTASNSAGFTLSLSAGNYLTTAMASNRGTDFVQATAAFAGTNASGTIASGGISVSVGNYITTAALSNHSHGNPTLALTNLSGTTDSNSAGFTLSLSANAGGANSSWTVSDAATSGTVGRLAFTNLNGVTLSLSSGTGGLHTIVGSHNALTTAAASNHSHGNPTLALTNLTGTTASASNGFTLSLSAAAPGGGAVVSNAIQDVGTATGSGTNTSRFAADDHVHRGVVGIVGVGTATTFYGSVHLSAGNNITLSTAGASNAGSIAFHAPSPGGGATYTYCYEPFDVQDGTATLSGSLSQLNLQPFFIQNNLSFCQLNLIGIATMPATSASNSHSARLTNSTQRYTFGTSYSIGNTNFVDWYLFSRGAGVSSSALHTFASTRNSFVTDYRMTYAGGATLTNTAGGSVSGSYSISMTISYPFLTTYTSTSVNPASSYTGYSSGYTTWTSSVSTQSTFTMSTSAARTLSVGSTFPATVGWSGAKRINMNFSTSLTPGDYWLGYVRHSSSSGSSSSANAFTGAAGTGNSYSATYNSTAFANTQQLTFMGKTATVVNSLGSLGFVTTANMAIAPGLGSFSGTWASNTTYLDNLANPQGAIALTQIRSNVSMFRSWFQLACQMPV